MRNLININDLERYLINEYGSVMNKPQENKKTELKINHKGDIPYTITSRKNIRV